MNPSGLKIDTSAKGQGTTSSVLVPTSPHLKTPFDSNARPHRLRSGSNASTSSSLSIVSPMTSSSTNASSSSFHLPIKESTSPLSKSFSSPASPSSPFFDDHSQVDADYVLAMHNYSPHQQGATCLSFRAGQVIHVLNRDPSGWWDGELEGRRGWFPSNYVNTDIHALADEDLPDVSVSCPLFPCFPGCQSLKLPQPGQQATQLHPSRASNSMGE